MSKYIAEYLTAVFLFMGVGAVIAASFYNNFNSIAIAAAHGGTIMILVAMLGKISGGHFNPMITWAAMIRGLYKDDGFDFLKGIGYIVAQLAGAVSGVAILYGLFYFIDGGKTAAEAVNYGTPALATGVSVWAGFILEMMFGFILTFVILRTAMEDNSPLAPLWIGGTIFILAASPLGAFTGAAMNPARWFGPALISGTWDNAWIYICAPLVGAVFALIVNDLVTLRVKVKAKKSAKEIMEEKTFNPAELG